MNDWTLDIGPYRVAATRGGSTRVELDLDEDCLEVDIEAGRAYMREHLTARIPLSVLVALLRGRGFKVERT